MEYVAIQRLSSYTFSSYVHSYRVFFFSNLGILSLEVPNFMTTKLARSFACTLDMHYYLS